MKRPITLIQVLAVFMPIIIIIIGWGISISSRMDVESSKNTKQDEEMDWMKHKQDKFEEKMDAIDSQIADKLERILYKLDEKEDRR